MIGLLADHPAANLVPPPVQRLQVGGEGWTTLPLPATSGRLSLRWDVDQRGATAHLTLRGRLDPPPAADLRAGCEMLLAQGITRFVVDLSELESVCSLGMAALLWLVKTAERAGGAVSFHSAPPTIEAIFELTHLNLVLSLHDSREEAVAGLPTEIAAGARG